MISCKKCSGTGNMGLISSVRCNVCSGTGEISGNEYKLIIEPKFSWGADIYRVFRSDEYGIKGAKRLVEGS
jgi:DnaJ-class molecular chaperone